MTCPRCGSSDIAHISDQVDGTEHGTCIISHSLCETCRFEVVNVAWLDEAEEVQYRAWMTGYELPNDVPKAVWDRLEEHRKSA